MGARNNIQGLIVLCRLRAGQARHTSHAIIFRKIAPEPIGGIAGRKPIPLAANMRNEAKSAPIGFVVFNVSQ